MTPERREANRIRSKAWYHANKGRAIQTAAAWREANPERVKAATKRHDKKRSQTPERKAARLRYIAAWKERNPGKSKEHGWRNHLKSRYGTTPEEYQAKFDAQNGQCEICKCALEPAPSVKTHLDHDHKTGRLRGLLCSKCNTRLPAIEDRVFAGQAELYLARHK